MFNIFCTAGPTSQVTLPCNEEETERKKVGNQIDVKNKSPTISANFRGSLFHLILDSLGTFISDRLHVA
jgi:hypothetical protein